MREWIAVACLCAGLGCGDSKTADMSGGGMCGAFSACGGDPVGTWDVESMCFEDLSAFSIGAIDEPACSDFLRSIDARPMGSLELRGDGTGTQQVSLQIDFEVTFTRDCIGALGGMASDAQCSALEGEFTSQSELAFAGCQLRNGGCDCVLTSTVMQLASMGSFEVRGSQLVDGGSATDFCVRSDRLTLREVTPMGAGQVVYKRR